MPDDDRRYASQQDRQPWSEQTATSEATSCACDLEIYASTRGQWWIRFAALQTEYLLISTLAHLQRSFESVTAQGTSQMPSCLTNPFHVLFS